MKTTILILFSLVMIKTERLIFDFKTAETSGKWYVVNDGVMGGISQSSIKIKENGIAKFAGTVSLKNFGGFASIRTLLHTDVNQNYKGVTLKLKGDGLKYSIRFRTNKRFDSCAYQSKVQTVKNKWIEVKLPFEDFKATYRGYTLNNKPMLKSTDIQQMGIMISDKQEGNFCIEIDWVKFYN